jgi:hypothetical protein
MRSIQKVIAVSVPSSFRGRVGPFREHSEACSEHPGYAVNVNPVGGTPKAPPRLFWSRSGAQGDENTGRRRISR